MQRILDLVVVLNVLLFARAEDDEFDLLQYATLQAEDFEDGSHAKKANPYGNFGPPPTVYGASANPYVGHHHAPPQTKKAPTGYSAALSGDQDHDTTNKKFHHAKHAHKRQRTGDETYIMDLEKDEQGNDLACKEGAHLATPPKLTGGCQRCTCRDGKWQCACSMRHRKEINDFTDEEFNRFSKAVNKLKEDGIWTQIALVHQNSNSQEHVSHFSAIFLPWHRKFMIAVENRLMVAASELGDSDPCSLAIPYWNWDLEMEKFADSAVFGNARLGSLNADLHGKELASADEMCVKDGAFGKNTATSAFGKGSNALGDADNGGEGCDCIRRCGTGITEMPYTDIISTLQDPKNGMADFYVMSAFLENDMHNHFHEAIGGWTKNAGAMVGPMSGMASPYDPMFFLHHGFVDYLYRLWQDAHYDEFTDLTMLHDGTKMNNLLFDDSSAEFPVTDVAFSMDILDDDPDTDAREKACVYYHERQEYHVCGPEWHAIKHCLNTVGKHGRLHEIPRIKESSSIGDVCSPLNHVQADMDRAWLEMMSRMGMLEEDKVDEILDWEEIINQKISENAPELNEDDATECDKAICFSIEELLNVCKEIDLAHSHDESHHGDHTAP